MATVVGGKRESEKVKSLSHVQLFAMPWTVACQTPLSVGFSRQEYWSGLPFSSPVDLSQPREWTWVSRIVGRLLSIWATREALATLSSYYQSGQTSRTQLLHTTQMLSESFKDIVFVPSSSSTPPLLYIPQLLTLLSQCYHQECSPHPSFPQDPPLLPGWVSSSAFLGFWKSAAFIALLS